MLYLAINDSEWALISFDSIRMPGGESTPAFPSGVGNTGS